MLFIRAEIQIRTFQDSENTNYVPRRQHIRARIQIRKHLDSNNHVRTVPDSNTYVPGLRHARLCRIKYIGYNLIDSRLTFFPQDNVK